jgi:hypothetical protein
LISIRERERERERGLVTILIEIRKGDKWERFLLVIKVGDFIKV